MATPLRPLPAGRRRAGLALPSGRTVLLALGGLVALNLLIVALVLGGQSETGPPLPAEIEAITPARGSRILPQEDVGVDLKDNYTGVILIDDVEMPLDQLKIVSALGQVTFRPGPSKEITAFTPGYHRATVEYWPADKTREEASRSYTWQFKAG
jgi:hypothetical protein